MSSGGPRPWRASLATIVLAVLAGCSRHGIVRSPAPSVPRTVVVPGPISPTHPPDATTTILTLCPPGDGILPRSDTPVTVPGTLRVLGLHHNDCESSYAEWSSYDEGGYWSDMLFITSAPPVRVSCPQPTTGWFQATRRMIIRETEASVDVECVLEPPGTHEEQVSLGRWQVPLSGGHDAHDRAVAQLADASTWGADAPGGPLAMRSFPSRTECFPTDDEFIHGRRMRVLSGLDSGAIVAVAYTVDTRVCAGVVHGSRALESDFYDASMLVPVDDPTPIAPVADLLGTWTDEFRFNVFVLRRVVGRSHISCQHGVPLRAQGCAWWYGGENENLHNEAIVHLGDLDGYVCSGDALLHVHDDRLGCSVLIASDGGRGLVLRDNEQCGGVNVRFQGAFTRRAWHSSNPWQHCPVVRRR